MLQGVAIGRLGENDAMSARGKPHFLVTGPDGRVKKRQADALIASPDVAARRLGL